ncbi:MAG: T9SS C-terminal target domain-containing protein [Calditrichaeota bacterium]|nr:MAG: T9SS C-terminal target domain-containing protein [Calditrichota bacterium]
MNLRHTLLQMWLPVLMVTLGLWAGSWTTGPSLHTPRAGASAVALDGYIYVLGGMTTGGTLLNSVERFDPATGQWDPGVVPPFNIPRADAAAVVYQGKIYLMGGRDGGDNAIKDVQVYDPVQNSWTTAQEMREKRAGHSAVILQNAICVFAGLEKEYEFVKEIEYFTGNDWEKSDSEMVELRVSAFAGVRDSTIFMLGGFYLGPTATGHRIRLIDNWGFVWQPGTPLAEARGAGASVQAGDSLYLIGGETLGGATNRVEILNLRTGTIHSAPPMPTPRKAIAAALWEGKIYVAGGIPAGQNQPTTLVEVYSDSTLTTLPQPPAPSPVQSFALLKAYPNPFNGRVTLQAEVNRTQKVSLVVYDLLGRPVQEIFRGQLSPGVHQFRWEARSGTNQPLASGIYLAVLRGRGWTRQQKVIYVK